jgi:hypothetical protein
VVNGHLRLLKESVTRERERERKRERERERYESGRPRKGDKLI